MEDGLINFNQYEETVPIIKVIGVGGGGGNAVEYMCEQGIRDVDFVLCNTDKQVVEHSKVPTKIQLGKKQTQGLGAGNRPEWGEAAAIESEEEIREVLSKNTKREHPRTNVPGCSLSWGCLCNLRWCSVCSGFLVVDGVAGLRLDERRVVEERIGYVGVDGSAVSFHLPIRRHFYIVPRSVVECFLVEIRGAIIRIA